MARQIRGGPTTKLTARRWPHDLAADQRDNHPRWPGDTGDGAPRLP
ncbi:MAG: hypothetical protein Q4C47_00680 [Planctomycetia bacterium]|nr:hypothetical protein [Planctomycetia bacterium]